MTSTSSTGDRPSEPQRADQSEFDDPFGPYFSRQGSKGRPVRMEGGLGWRPATDVYETESEFVVQVDLAGMDRDGIEVQIDAEFLVIRGTRANIAVQGKKHFHEMEIRVGPFERHVRVPSHVDVSTTTARYESGFLFVSMKRGHASSGEVRNVTIGP